jgi:hypothetical protein
MLTLDDTELQSFSFGKKQEDKYYLLINTKINAVGIDLAKLANADPLRFDAVLDEMGCILMLSGDEIEELIRRGSIKQNSMHASLFELARTESLI